VARRATNLLVSGGVVTRDEFAARIETLRRAHYECWAAALERFVLADGFVTPGELENAVNAAMALDRHDHR
jgi:hypothetical protein